MIGTHDLGPVGSDDGDGGCKVVKRAEEGLELDESVLAIEPEEVRVMPCVFECVCARACVTFCFVCLRACVDMNICRVYVLGCHFAITQEFPKYTKTRNNTNDNIIIINNNNNNNNNNITYSETYLMSATV